MTRLPFDPGPIHLVGIGGIGMSGIAELLHDLGYRVRGSDLAPNANTARLERLGIRIHIGHRAEHVEGAGVVVVSSAVPADNPEVAAARRQRIPVIRRAEMLGELMRFKWPIAVAGSHGKTTTTAIIGALLEEAGLDPTVVNGGIVNAWGSNLRRGGGPWMVVEADESDGSFLHLPAMVGVVTNIDPEHLDHHGSLERLEEAFLAFLEGLPFYGFAVLGIDHPRVQRLCGRLTSRRFVTYGFNPQADVRALGRRLEDGVERFDVEVRNPTGMRRIAGLSLALPGRHNVQNALAAIAIADRLGIPDRVVRSTLAALEGVRRRFTITGTVDEITVVDDYGHHPEEIRRVLETARQLVRRRLVAVVQPHRFSRLHHLFDEFCTCFADADTVWIAPVYAAGESPIAGVDHLALVEGVRACGHRDVRPLDGLERLAEALVDQLAPGDMVVCLGAGDITRAAQALPSRLQALRRGEGT